MRPTGCILGLSQFKPFVAQLATGSPISAYCVLHRKERTCEIQKQLASERKEIEL